MATRAEVAARSAESKNRRAMRKALYDNMFKRVDAAGWGVLVRFSVPDFTEAQLLAAKQEAYKRLALDRRKLYTTYLRRGGDGKVQHLDVAFTWRKKA